MSARSFFDANPIFRYEEFVQFMQLQGIDRPASWKKLLSYHREAGHLIHIRKFLYAVKPPGEEQWIDPYVIAGKATKDAIVGYHTALELHGVAYTSFTEFQYLTERAVLPFSYEAQRFRSVCFPKALLDQKKTDFCVETIKRQRVVIKLTNLERTIVDILARPDLGGGWEEIWRSFDNITQLDLDKLIEYTLLLRNATVVAKVGFFLEQRPSHLSVDSAYIKKLLPHIPKQPHYMNRNRQGLGKYIEKWQLIVPVEIIERTWEEPGAENI